MDHVPCDIGLLRLHKRNQSLTLYHSSSCLLPPKVCVCVCVRIVLLQQYVPIMVHMRACTCIIMCAVVVLLDVRWWEGGADEDNEAIS